MSDNFFDNIDGGLDQFTSVENILNLSEGLPDVVDEENLPSIEPSNEEKKRDENFAIQHLKNVSKITEQSAKELFVLAKSSDSPRAWEVLATMLKVNVDTSKTLLDSVREVKQTNIEGDVTNNITQNNITLSTEELIDLFNEDEDEKDIEDAEVIEDDR